jgi:arylsulfatase A-like enzyme
MRQLLILFCIGTSSATAVSAAGSERPNVLFIAIDDLNHWVGHLTRNPQTKTPNIDRLASEGVAFRRAYCTAPACNPSRASLMSGLRPSTTGCYLNGQNWRAGVSEDKLLNSHFARAGYRVYGAGKIYHGAADRGGTWTDYFPGMGNTHRHADAANDGVGSLRFYPATEQDEEMPDYKVVSYGLEKLAEEDDRPFFLAIGLVKPHLPFSVPKKWFEMFPLESIELPPHRDDDLNDIPGAGIKMARPNGDHARILKSGRWKEAVQAYLASIAFCDAQVGRLLDGLNKSRHRDNTIVVLWSDHGWSLGEKSHWRKFALWEEPTRTVFVWKAPGVTQPGGVCARTVDYTSVYPTLCELAGLPQPEHLEGTSLKPLLANPQVEWSSPAITTHGRNNHTVRTEDWRYIRYADGSEELYDERADPLEYTNLAGQPKYDAQKAALAKHLPEQNAKNLPSRRQTRKKNKAQREQAAATIGASQTH